MSRLALLVTLMTLSACSSAPGPRITSSPVTSSMQADRLVLEADVQLQAGNPTAAVRILEDVVRRFPDAPVHARALYDLARAQVLSVNGGREYRHAAGHLDRLLREYPTSQHAPDARALRAAIGAYVARTAELERLLERLKAIDLEFERPLRP